jgi:perosamine synthetase
MIPISQAPISFTEVLRTLYADLMNNPSAFQILQQSLSNYLNCKNIILMTSGSTALYSLLRAYKLKTDDEVIIPAYLCENVPRLIEAMGFKIKFVDVEPFTYNMDPNDLSEKITDSTKVVIAVHMFGYPCQIEDIVEIAHDHSALVIEDAAQALGAEYNGEKNGTFGDSGFFSMGVGKPISTINGGAICTKDEKVVKEINKLVAGFKSYCTMHQIKTLIYMAGYAFANSRIFYTSVYKLVRRTNSNSRVDVQELMYKYTNLQSILGAYQLSKLDSFNKIRTGNANYLMRNLEHNSIRFPCIPKHTKPIFLRLPIYIEGIKREDKNELVNMFNRSGIEISTYMDISLPQLFNRGSNECPVSRRIASETITIPTHPNVTKRDLNLIIELINNWSGT